MFRSLIILINWSIKYIFGWENMQKKHGELTNLIDIFQVDKLQLL